MPGLYLCGFLIPAVAGAVFLAALLAKCFLGALAPVFFLAVYLVLAILFALVFAFEFELKHNFAYGLNRIALTISRLLLD